MLPQGSCKFRLHMRRLPPVTLSAERQAIAVHTSLQALEQLADRQPCVQMLQSAQQLSVQQQQARDETAYDYNNLLRAGIFEAYSGIFHAMGATGNQYLQEAAKVLPLPWVQPVRSRAEA